MVVRSGYRAPPRVHVPLSNARRWWTGGEPEPMQGKEVKSTLKFREAKRVSHEGNEI